MKLAIITPNGKQALVERPLNELAKEAALRMYPEKHNVLGKDRDKWKRDLAEKAIYDTLLRMSLEVARL